MTYFELFEIPVQLKIDKTTLPRQFFALSRKYHPDFFTNAAPAVQAEMLERSAALNKAFRIFQDNDETIKYVLQLKGLLEEEEKFELPPAFLMEVMEINEALMDADDDAVRQRLSASIDQLQEDIYTPVKDTIENYREGITPLADLLPVKEYYYKKKYIDRIRRQLNG